jgi:FkbM family methyltransferase
MRTNGELYLAMSVLPKSRLVFDIGANVGHWASMALKINPRINLHCFEPSRATYQKLIDNKFHPNVTCNNFGLSSSVTEAKLLIFEDGAGINSLYRREGLEDGWGLSTQQQEELVYLETLDRYCDSNNIKEPIDFCKVDSEGHELEIFKGMSAMLEAKQIKVIQFEYGGCNIDAGVLLKDIFCFFQRYDYTFYKIYPARLRPVVRYDQRLENFQNQNWAIMANVSEDNKPESEILQRKRK